MKRMFTRNIQKPIPQLSEVDFGVLFPPCWLMREGSWPLNNQWVTWAANGSKIQLIFFLKWAC